MSDVIDFLDRVGQDANLRHASADELEREALGAGLDPLLQAAIRAKDSSKLSLLLGQGPYCGLINPGKEDEDEDEDEDGDGDEDGR